MSPALAVASRYSSSATRSIRSLLALALVVSSRFTNASRSPFPTVSGTPPVSPRRLSACFFARSFSATALDARLVALDERAGVVAGHARDDPARQNTNALGRPRRPIQGEPAAASAARSARRASRLLAPVIEVHPQGAGALSASAATSAS